MDPSAASLVVNAFLAVFDLPNTEFTVELWINTLRSDSVRLIVSSEEVFQPNVSAIVNSPLKKTA